MGGFCGEFDGVDDLPSRIPVVRSRRRPLPLNTKGLLTIWFVVAGVKSFGASLTHDDATPEGCSSLFADPGVLTKTIKSSPWTFPGPSAEIFP